MRLFGGESETTADDDIIGQAVDYTVELSVSAAPQVEDEDVFGASDIESASALIRGQDEPGTGVAGLLAEARADYRRILGALYADGRYGGVISIRANGQEVSALPPDAQLATPIVFDISVDPGPIYTFGRLDVRNPAPVPIEEGDEVDGFFDLGFTPGSVARSGVIRRAESTTVDGWREQGHALAERLPRSIEADHSSRTIDVTIGAEPGPLNRFGSVSVEGADRMDADFIAWMTGVEEGVVYDPDDIEAAQNRLAALEVFQSVRVEVGEQTLADGSLPVTVFVQERPLRRIGVGGNFSTVDGAGVEAYWLHRNLFGGAERLRIDGRISGIDGTDPEVFTHRFNAALRVPGVITRDTVGTATATAEREVLDAYTLTGIRGAVGLEHPFTPRLTGRIELAGRFAEFDDPVFGRREFQSAGFTGALVFDGRDVPTDATSGIYLEASANPFYEFSRSAAGVVLQAEARAYQRLGFGDRLVLAGRVRAGSLVGSSIADTAPDRLFLAGGGGSVRGYAYRNIGVEQPGGNLTGGRSLLEGSLELRARFTDTIGGVVFADAGIVDADSFGSFNEDLKIGVGAGLRYRTPIGPVRLDVGFPLDPGPNDPDFAVYLGIGQSF
ncbi:MAG: autotransporter assembly complex family protein [Pseudomonadota bacterium]